MREFLAITDGHTGEPGAVHVDRRGPARRDAGAVGSPGSRGSPGTERGVKGAEEARAPGVAEAGTETRPLLLLGGVTQTLTSWTGSMRRLSASRPTLVYEARGQGRTRLSLGDVDFPRHVDDFSRVIAAAGFAPPVDLCGFSFGGRVGLAIAATRPELVRRLVIVGVGAGRGVLGRVIVRSWQEALRCGDLEALAWSSLADIVGPAFLERHERFIPDIIRATLRRNSYEGTRALLERTMDSDPASRWAPLTLAPAIRCPTLLLAGRHDRLAPVAEVEALAAAFLADVPVQVEISEISGHTVVVEDQEFFRRRLLDFLDEAVVR